MMKNIARNFYDLGLNIYGTTNQLNENNFYATNLTKAPSKNKEFNSRQTIEDFNKITWDTAIGFGTYLGFEDLRAIDIDGTLDEKIVNEICEILDLPENYSWIFESGSRCGYHIFFKCKLPEGLKVLKTTPKFFKPAQYSEPYEFGALDTNAYYPNNDTYGINHNFFKIEFKWHGHIILPSSLHQSGCDYSFLNEFPDQAPNSIDFDKLRLLKSEFASTQAKTSDFHIDGIYERPTSRYSHRLTYKDSIPYNFQSKFKEPGLIFHISQFSVHNSEHKSLFMNQISWFIIDCNYNVVKRHIYNYYSSNNRGDLYAGNIDVKQSNKIIQNNRFIYHEFLFDLMHAEKIYCWDSGIFNILKEEISKSGLYHDMFLREIRISENESYLNKLYNYSNINSGLFKATVFINNLLNDCRETKHFEDHEKLYFKEKMEKINWYIEVLINNKNLNSIKYLTTMYTLYLFLKRN